MDSQSSVADCTPIVALIQSLACLALEGDRRPTLAGSEILAENRFLAARDGMSGRVIDPGRRAMVPIRALAAELLDRCRPHAAAVGRSEELELVGWLAATNGAQRQREWVSDGGDLPSMLTSLVEQFAAPREGSSCSTQRFGRSHRYVSLACL